MSDDYALELMNPATFSLDPSHVSYEAAPSVVYPGMSIVIGASSPALLFGLESLVRAMPGVAIYKATHSLEQLVSYCREAGDCVVLVDPALCGHDVRGFMQRLYAACAGASVVLISDGCQPHAVREAIKGGVRGFVEKTAQPREIRDALVAVARGQRYLGTTVTTGLADSLLLEDLTPREMDVLRLMARPECNKAIARELDVTLGTVKTHVGAILSKLDSRSRTDAVLKACRLGLVRIA